MAEAPTKTRDMLAMLARHSELLEAEAARLTTAQEHWQLLEAEYEALGDEVQQAIRQFPDAASNATQAQAQTAELVRIRRDFDGQLVDHKTVYELFGARLGQTITRSATAIFSAIDRRLDYVKKNVATLARQATETRNKLAAAQVIRQPDAAADDDDDDDDGQAYDDDGPVTDIVEQLDDDDNVVGVQLNRPASTQTQVLEALAKAGVDEIPAGGPLQDEKKDETKPAETKPGKTQFKPNLSKARKGVSFADDAKTADGAGSTQYTTTFAAQRLSSIMQSAKEQETLVDADAAVPADESEDDAALRREMLEYSMSEIGPIVAQLDVEEGLTDDDDEGYDDGFFDDDDDDEYDEYDDEDQFGRSKYSVIDEAYRERMRELEAKLGVKPLANQSILPREKPPTVLNRDDIAESLGRIRVADADVAKSESTANDATTEGGDYVFGLTPEPAGSVAKTSALKKSDKGKTVSFASGLDIAPAVDARAPTAPTAPPAPAVPFVEPVSTVVVERSSAAKPAVASPAEPDRPKRVSRFKKDRAAPPVTVAGSVSTTHGLLPKGPNEAPVRFLDGVDDRHSGVAPTGPEGKTLADAIVERAGPSAAREPHELDAHLVLQETATAYHQTRNRLIQQQGGFMKASEAAVVPVDQDDGGPRISKFKAARMGKQFMDA